MDHDFDEPGCNAYQVSFHAIDNGGSEGVDQVNMQINPINPPTPTGFAIQDVSTDYTPYVSLAWDPVVSAYPGFDIRYRVFINNLSPDSPAYTVTNPSFMFDEAKGAAVGSLFRFSVCAFYVCTPSVDLQSGLVVPPLSIMIEDSTPPAPPTGLNGTVPVTDPSTVVLNWTASPTPDVASYKVYRHKGTPGGNPPFDPGTLGGWDDITGDDLDPTNTSFVDGLGPDGIPGANGHTTFCYVVTAVDNANNESFTASTMPCLIPQGVVPYVLLVENTGEKGRDSEDAENFEHRTALVDLGLDEDSDFEIIRTWEYDETDPDDRDREEFDLRLNSRDLVIWFTSDVFEDFVLSDFQVGLLQDYLDAGGNLIMDGDDAAYELANDNPNFMNRYLSIQLGSVNDKGANDESDIKGVLGSIYNGWSARRNAPEGFEDSFTVDNGAGGQEALAILDYPTNPNYRTIGVQHHDTGDDYYVMFMSVGLEDILESLDREQFMRRAFNWMDVYLP